MPQSPLKLEDFLPYRLSLSSNLVSARIAKAYESLFAISIPEWRLIAVVAERGQVTQQRICAVTRMDKVTVSRAAKALAHRQLLGRTGNPDDNRSQLLHLTADGLTLYEAIAPKAKALESEIFSCLTEREQEMLRGLLEKLDCFNQDT